MKMDLTRAATQVEVAAMSADDDSPRVSSSKGSSDTGSEVHAMSADEDKLDSESEEGSDMV